VRAVKTALDAGGTPAFATRINGCCWRREFVARSPGGTTLYKTVAALAVAVLAAGCTSVRHGRGSSAPPASVQSAQGTSHQLAPDLKAQLLTVAELPTGWSIDNSNSGDNTSTPSCLQRLDSAMHTNDTADASFVKGSDVPTLAQFIGYFADVAP